MNSREATRKYRLNQWISIVRECRNSGETVTAWCREHDVDTKRYYYWLKKVRTAASEALPAFNPENTLICPVNITSDITTSNNVISEHCPSAVIRFGNMALELFSNTSSDLIENALRAIKNVG